MRTNGNQARLASKKKKEEQAPDTVEVASNPAVSNSLSTIYFWRESERHHGFMCQWFPSPFTVDGKLYFTAEHWMMAGKAKLFNDMHMHAKILKSEHPGKAKALGRQVKGFYEKIWLQHCNEIVEEGNMHKFCKNPGLRQRLLATGNRELVEASPKDRVWGIGFDAVHAESMRSQWGENRLGLALMRVRQRLRENAEQGVEDEQSKDPEEA